MKSWCTAGKVRQFFTPVGRPSSNGIVESIARVIGDYVRVMALDLEVDIDAELIQNCLVRTQTRLNSQNTLGRVPSVEIFDYVAKTGPQVCFNNRGTPWIFATENTTGDPKWRVGTRVLIKEKLDKGYAFRREGIITEIIGRSIFRVQDKLERSWVMHCNDLRKKPAEMPGYLFD